MNSLSWLLYLIYVLGALSSFLGVVIFFGTFIIIITTIIYLVSVFDTKDTTKDTTDDQRRFIKRGWVSVLSIYIVSTFLWVAIPDGDTVKLIAASEVSEFLINTETGQKVINEAGKQVGKSGEIMSDSLELLHQYVKNELKNATKVNEVVKSNQ